MNAYSLEAFSRAGERVSAGGVIAQVLIVPACLAAFGLAILVIVATL